MLLIACDIESELYISHSPEFDRHKNKEKHNMMSAITSISMSIISLCSQVAANRSHAKDDNNRIIKYVKVSDFDNCNNTTSDEVENFNALNGLTMVVSKNKINDLEQSTIAKVHNISTNSVVIQNPIDNIVHPANHPIAIKQCNQILVGADSSDRIIEHFQSILEPLNTKEKKQDKSIITQTNKPIGMKCDSVEFSYSESNINNSSQHKTISMNDSLSSIPRRQQNNYILDDEDGLLDECILSMDFEDINGPKLSMIIVYKNYSLLIKKLPESVYEFFKSRINKYRSLGYKYTLLNDINSSQFSLSNTDSPITDIALAIKTYHDVVKTHLKTIIVSDHIQSNDICLCSCNVRNSIFDNMNHNLSNSVIMDDNYNLICPHTHIYNNDDNKQRNHNIYVYPNLKNSIDIYRDICQQNPSKFHNPFQSNLIPNLKICNNVNLSNRPNMYKNNLFQTSNSGYINKSSTVRQHSPMHFVRPPKPNNKKPISANRIFRQNKKLLAKKTRQYDDDNNIKIAYDTPVYANKINVFQRDMRFRNDNFELHHLTPLKSMHTATSNKKITISSSPVHDQSIAKPLKRQAVRQVQQGIRKLSMEVNTYKNNHTDIFNKIQKNRNNNYGHVTPEKTDSMIINVPYKKSIQTEVNNDKVNKWNKSKQHYEQKIKKSTEHVSTKQPWNSNNQC